MYQASKKTILLLHIHVIFLIHLVRINQHYAEKNIAIILLKKQLPELSLAAYVFNIIT